MKQAEVKYFVDEDTLGLAYVLADIRSDVTYPGDEGGTTVNKRHRPACPIARRTLDVDWIPIVAQNEWLVITRDRNISKRTAEKAAVQEAGAKLVAITSSEDLNNFGLLEVVMCRWRDISGLVDLPGPFIYSATRTTFNKIDSF